MDGVEHGRLLDLGPAFQSTINFFIERGFRVTTDDLLRDWKEFLDSQEERLRKQAAGDPDDELTPAALAESFLDESFSYPSESFHAVLAWDLFDYLDSDLMKRVVDRIHKLLWPGGAVLATFHSRPPDSFCRYRLADNQSIELVPTPSPFTHKRVFQNREMMNLFSQFRSSKTFVGRDQLREGLFLK